MKSNGVYTQYNMKGKKVYLMPCGCCTAINLKEWYWEKIAKKEIRDYNKYDE